MFLFLNPALVRGARGDLIFSFNSKGRIQQGTRAGPTFNKDATMCNNGNVNKSYYGVLIRYA